MGGFAKTNRPSMKPMRHCALAMLAFLTIPAAHAATEAVTADNALSAAATADHALSAAQASGVVDVWMAQEGATLSDTLASWSERAGWKLIWESESDFRLAAGGSFEGEFPSAAQKLIEAFGRTRPRLRATFYRGNSVLRVWAERAEP